MPSGGCCVKRKSVEFVAEYQPHVRPVAHLSDVLDRYATLSARHASPDEQVVLEEREEFLIEWTSRREDTLRASLEQVTWELEEARPPRLDRGHRR